MPTNMINWSTANDKTRKKKKVSVSHKKVRQAIDLELNTQSLLVMKAKITEANHAKTLASW